MLFCQCEWLCRNASIILANVDRGGRGLQSGAVEGEGERAFNVSTI